MSGPLLIVASQFGQKLDFFDATTLEKLSTIEGLIAQPHEIAWDPNRRLAYLTHTYRAGGYGEDKGTAHELSVIDPDRQEIVDVIDIDPYQGPHDVDFDPVADLIYTGVERVDGRNGIVIVDPATREVVGDIPLEARNAHWLSVAPGGERAYVSHKEVQSVTAVDLHGRREIASIPSAGGTEEIDCSPDGRHVFVAAPTLSIENNVSIGQLTKKTPPAGTPEPRVLKIDAEKNEVVGRADFTEQVSALRVAPDGRVIVSEMHFPEPGSTATGPVNGRVHIIDPDSMDVLASIEAEDLPFTVRCSPDSKTAFIANLKSGSVTVLDLDTYAIVATLDNNIGPGFGGTHGLCYVPAKS